MPVKTTKKHRHTKSAKISKRGILLLAAVILLLGALGIVAATRDTTSGSTVDKPAVDTTKVTPRPTTSKGESTAPGSTTDPTTPPIATNVTLEKPVGTLVSNHKPGQNGSPLNEESTCTTTPGASCVITFTKDGVTKSLPAKTVDSSGTAYWTWTPASVGLTAGNWNISVVATLGQQTATNQDSIALQVSQ